MKAFKTQNPYTGEVEAEYDAWTKEEIDEAFERSYDAFLKYRETDIPTRCERLRNVASILKENRDEYAKLVVTEMGKTIKEARGEVDRCADYCEYYAKNAEELLKDDHVKTAAEESYITYQPIGPLMLVQPWNYPFWLAFKTVIPQLLVGNSVLVKNASNNPQCGAAMQKVYEEAGFEGVYQYAPIRSEDLELAVSHKYCRGGSLTGSTVAGKSFGEICGRYAKKCVLELGGSDPFIVLDDANLDKAADLGVKSRFKNNAQACTNAKRFIVHESVYDEYKQKVIDILSKMKVGDPMDEKTDLGPLAKENSIKALRHQIKDTVDKGGKIGYGDEAQLEGDIDASKGFFFTPVILEDIPEDSEAYREELFGPVLSFFKIKDDEEAIRLANDNQYGLGGAVHTADLERGKKFCLRVETGMMNVNSATGGSNVLPYGGIKNSGYGRESSVHGCREFVNIKTVQIFKA